MLNESLPPGLANQVSPRALCSYAEALGWQPVPKGKRPEIAVYHRPDSRLHQVLIPVDHGLIDYGEMVADAVRRLAEYEKRPARAVLENLLLPSQGGKPPTLSAELIQSSPRALSVGHALLAADRAVLAEGTNPAESIVYIQQHQATTGQTWRIQYATPDSRDRRGGGLIVEVDAATGTVLSVLRGQ